MNTPLAYLSIRAKLMSPFIWQDSLSDQQRKKSLARSSAAIFGHFLQPPNYPIISTQSLNTPLTLLSIRAKLMSPFNWQDSYSDQQRKKS